MENMETELEALENVFGDASAEPIKLSYALLRYITDNFSNEIGRGGFGVVYMGNIEKGKVAVKKLSTTHALPDNQFLDEITCLKDMNHRNIVRFLGYCSDTEGEVIELNGKFIMKEIATNLLCFEYVPNGDIRHYIQQEKPNGDDWFVRYQMIRGICQGLQYLHDKLINHLDLKPENVMLDAHMEPKITDFGLSRCLDQGQSKIITQNICGTRRYIAPEIIDKGEISLKSDIYALGIIIIELLTGIDNIDLNNWEGSLEVGCPRVERCTEIARNCTDPEKNNRPTIGEVVHDLDDLENMIQLSLIDQHTQQQTAFHGTDLIDFSPRDLRFLFVPNGKMSCELSLTNKTDGAVYFAIVPQVRGRYSWRTSSDCMPPMHTTTITVNRKVEMELPSDNDKLEILVLVTGCDEDDMLEKLSTLCLDEDATTEDTFKAAHECLGFELHRAMLTAMFVSKDSDQTLVACTPCLEGKRFTGRISGTFTPNNVSLDVHPTEPWVLVVEYGNKVHIWNWRTNEKLGQYKRSDEYHAEITVAQFIARKRWVVIGNSDGSILVLMCPSLEKLEEFKAQPDGVASLAVHPTRPFLLSCSGNSNPMRLWDWSRGWSCTTMFVVTKPVQQVMFNPKHSTTFASLNMNASIMMWRIGHPNPIATIRKPKGYEKGYLSLFFYRSFSYIGDQHCIAATREKSAFIWDLQKQEHVHTLNTRETIVAIISHPTRPILVTASADSSIHVWDSITYRLKKDYVDLGCNPRDIAFTGSRWLVVGHERGILVMDTDLE